MIWLSLLLFLVWVACSHLIMVLLDDYPWEKHPYRRWMTIIFAPFLSLAGMVMTWYYQLKGVKYEEEL